jgi:hypothetical protein
VDELLAPPLDDMTSAVDDGPVLLLEFAPVDDELTPLLDCTTPAVDDDEGLVLELTPVEEEDDTPVEDDELTPPVLLEAPVEDDIPVLLEAPVEDDMPVLLLETGHACVLHGTERPSPSLAGHAAPPPDAGVVIV